MLRIGIFNDTSKNNHYGCLAVMSTIIYEIEKRNAKIEFFWPVNKDWRKFKKNIIKKNVDIFIVNGEGTIHDTNKSSKGRMLAEVALFAKENSIPAYLINSTLYNIDKETFTLLRKFDKIYVRETGTSRYLKENNLDSCVVPDLSFFTPHLLRKNLHKIKEDCNSFYITDSVKKNYSSMLEQLSKDLGCEFETMVEKDTFILKLLKMVNRRIPFSLLPSLRNNSDYRGLIKFIEKIEKSKLIITGRFHTSTLALATKTPLLAIESNTPKINFLLNDIFNNSNRLLTHSQLNNEYITNNSYAYNESEEKKLNNYIKVGQIKVDEMFDEIIELKE